MAERSIGSAMLSRSSSHLAVWISWLEVDSIDSVTHLHAARPAEQQFEAAGAFEKGDANLVAFGRSFHRESRPA